MALSFRLVNEKHPNAYPLLHEINPLAFMTPAEWRVLPDALRQYYLEDEYIIALEDGVPAGFIKFRLSERRARVYTQRTFVRVPSRKKGIAEELIKRLVKHCYTRGYSLIVRRSLASSILRQVERFEKNGMGLPFRARAKRIGPYDAVIHIPRRPSLIKARSR